MPTTEREKASGLYPMGVVTHRPTTLPSPSFLPSTPQNIPKGSSL